MALRYLKLANVAQAITDGEFTKAELLTGIITGGLTSGDYIVVNLKGRILTASQVEQHLDGTLDGETVTA